MSIDKNKQLMLDAGSKTGAYDVEAPDQWKWVLLHSTDADEKGMAWVKSKTTAFNHESPFCVDEHGHAVYVQHMAAELGWKEQTARNVLCRLEAQGRIRLEKGKRIWYCADVPQSREAPTKPDGKAPGKGAGNNSVQSYWGTYVADFIEKLPDEKRAEAETKTESYLEWRREFMADGEAALRAIADRVEDTTLREIGVPKKRLPKRRPAECKWVQLELLAEPNFVQSYDPEASPESVQSADDGLYEPKINGVRTQNGALSFSASTTTTAKLASQPSPADVEELQEHLEAIAEEHFPRLKPPSPNKQTCQNILRLARAADADATVPQIGAAIVSWAGKEKGFATWGGVYELLKKAWNGAAGAGG